MPGMRTHAEWSQRMLAEYRDESAKMLPGFDQVFNTDKARGALYWASNTPDWYNVGKYLNDIVGYVGDVQTAFTKTNGAVNGALDSARRATNGAVGDVIGTVNKIIDKLPVNLPKIPDVPPIPHLPQMPVFSGTIAILQRLKAEADTLTPGGEDLAHWVPFCREYAEYLRSQHNSDPYAQAFFLGVVAHVMEDIPFHFDGPEWPAQGYGDGVYMVDRVQGDSSQGQRPVIKFFEKRAQQLGIGETRIDEYLVGSSPQNSVIHNDIVASWAALPRRLEELQAVYRRVGLPSGKTSTLTRCVEIQQEIWNLEQQIAKEVGSYVTALNKVADDYSTALRGVTSAINTVLDGVSKLPLVPKLPHVPEPPSIPHVPNPLDLSREMSDLFYNYYYAGLENAAAFTATGVQTMYAYLEGWQFYRSDLGCTDYRLWSRSPIRDTQQIEYPQYTGVTQTQISQQAPNNNAGGEPLFQLRGGATNRIHGLIRFELAANEDAVRNIPPGTAVEQATLWLYLSNRSNPATKNAAIELYKVNAPWDGGDKRTDIVNGTAGQLAAGDQATWLEPLQGRRQPWQKPGCEGVPGDRDERPVASATPAPSPAPQWVSWDISQLVQSWIDHRDQNHGVLLRPADQASANAEVYTFYSSQAFSGSAGELGHGERIARRPTLVVRLKHK